MTHSPLILDTGSVAVYQPDPRHEGNQRNLRSYLARYVRAGQVKRADGSPAGFTIQPTALSDAVNRGLFDSKPVFLNHAGFLQSPDLGNLVGRTSPVATFNAAGNAVEGDIELLDTPAGRVARTIIDDILANPGPDIGLSIVFYPIWSTDPGVGAGLSEQRSPASGDLPSRTIVGITHIESIDLVFQPAADGRILSALSAHHLVGAGLSERTPASGDPPFPGPSGDLPIPPDGNSSTPSAPNPLNPFPTGVVHRQSVDSFSQQKGILSMPETTPLENVTPDTSTRDTSIDAWIQATAESAQSAVLAASGLPEPARRRLAASRYATPDDLRSAIETERSYLATLQENSVVQIGGQPPRGSHVTGMRTSLDQITLALDALLAGSRPADGIQPLTGIRELYHHLSGDYEMTGLFQPDRVQFATVNSSTMSNLVANVLNKRVALEFQNYPMWWQPIVLEENFQSLQAIKWLTLGGIGELPTVAEGAAYTELAWDDSAQSASFVKKGGYLGITLESIDKDDTARLRAAPRALAQAAWLTLSKAISAIFTSASGVGPTLADSVALFDASGHGNLGTTALSIASYNAARLAMRKQTELNSGERLGALTAPKFLLVPPDLEITALQVLATDYDYTYALSNGQAAPVNVNADGDSLTQRMNAARSRVIVVDLWTDANDWAAVADPRMYPTIGVGYRYGRAPEIFSIASPTAGLMFTNDTMPIKTRFFFACAPIDYRGLYKANVA